MTYSSSRVNYKTQFWYFITISPTDRPGRMAQLFKWDSNTICLALRKSSPHYVFYPELDKDTLRLHYHGIAKINKFGPFKNYSLPKLESLGYVKVKRIKSFIDHLRILVYCQKDFCMINDTLPRLVYRKLKPKPKVKIFPSSYDKPITILN